MDLLAPRGRVANRLKEPVDDLTRGGAADPLIGRNAVGNVRNLHAALLLIDDIVRNVLDNVRNCKVRASAMARISARERHKDELIDAAALMLARAPFAAFSREALARECGAKSSTVRSYFPDLEWLKRKAVARIFARVRSEIEALEVAPAATVHQAARSFLQAFADLLGRGVYVDMLRVLVRESLVEAWVGDLYREQVLGTAAAALAQHVRAAGRRYGTHVSLRDGVGETVLGRMEAAIALPTLLPSWHGCAVSDRSAAVERATSDTIAGTFAFEFAEAA
ncbi:MAG: TetR/AcrR family transcriptional regulator [Allosphingosinicella sp.]|uniref:TetR/AcrR family transcriptional regulator n=1 Tax=Allosphingosinicella sp. TaxID=2823234 RepID=UPI00392D1CD4